MKSLSPPLACHFHIKYGTFLMHLWLLGRSLGSRPGPQPPEPTARRRRRRKKIRGGTRNLLSLPGDNEDNNGWGDGNNKGAIVELIVRVSHDQSCFAPGSTTILTLVDRPHLEPTATGRGRGERTDERQQKRTWNGQMTT
jgi:hypothetical protein